MNAASNQPGLVPGSLATIYGANLATTTAQAQTPPWPTTLGGASVLVGGISAPLSYAGPGQINFQVPWEAAGGAGATVVVMNNDSVSAGIKVVVFNVQPGLFRSTGRHALAVNARTAKLVSSADPARPGDTLTLYATGLGPVTQQQQSGAAASMTVLAYLRDPLSVSIGDAPADVSFAGLVPGSVGLYQINVLVPSVLSGETILLNATGGSTSASLAAAQPGAWIETFDDSTLDPTRWTPSDLSGVEGTSDAGCVLCNYGVFDHNNVSSTNGFLMLRLSQRSNATRQIQSSGGEITSVRTFQYGTYEFRMRASSTASTPYARGTCLPGSVSGAFNYLKNSETEIDFEALGDQQDRINVTSWFNFIPDLPPLHDRTMETTSTIPVPNVCQEFSTYAFRWDPGKLTFSVNGRQPLPPFTTTIPTMPASIILNHWGTVDPTWGGNHTTDPTNESLTVARYLYVDWIKYTPLAP